MTTHQQLQAVEDIFKRPLQPSGAQDRYHVTVTVPAFQFTHYFQFGIAPNCFCFTSVKGADTNPLGANTALDTAVREIAISGPPAETVLISIHNKVIGTFDRLWVIHPNDHTFFKQRDVQNEAWVVYPAFRCEVRGDETREEIGSLLEDFMSPADWTRSPRCQVRFRFNNARARAYTSGSVFVLEREQVVLHHLLHLGGAGSFLDLLNFTGSRLRFSLDEHEQMFVETGSSRIPTNCRASVELARAFIRGESCDIGRRFP